MASYQTVESAHVSIECPGRQRLVGSTPDHVSDAITIQTQELQPSFTVQYDNVITQGTCNEGNIVITESNDEQVHLEQVRSTTQVSEENEVQIHTLPDANMGADMQTKPEMHDSGTVMQITDNLSMLPPDPAASESAQQVSQAANHNAVPLNSATAEDAQACFNAVRNQLVAALTSSLPEHILPIPKTKSKTVAAPHVNQTNTRRSPRLKIKLSKKKPVLTLAQEVLAKKWVSL